MLDDAALRPYTHMIWATPEGMAAFEGAGFSYVLLPWSSPTGPPPSSMRPVLRLHPRRSRRWTVTGSEKRPSTSSSSSNLRGCPDFSRSSPAVNPARRPSMLLPPVGLRSTSLQVEWSVGIASPEFSGRTSFQKERSKHCSGWKRKISKKPHGSASPGNHLKNALAFSRHSSPTISGIPPGAWLF